EPPRIIATTGWTTDELAAALDELSGTDAAPRGPYDLVSLLIGVNDQYRDRDVEAYRAGFDALLQRAVGFAGGDPSRVLVLSIPDWGVMPFAEGRDRGQIAAAIDQFNRAAYHDAMAAGARWVDVTPISRRAATDPSLVAGDGLHPAGRMYAYWAELALPHAWAALGRGPLVPSS